MPFKSNRYNSVIVDHINNVIKEIIKYYIDDDYYSDIHTSKIYFNHRPTKRVKVYGLQILAIGRYREWQKTWEIFELNY